MKLNQHNRTELWQQSNAKEPAKGLGVQVENTWYWYEPWLEQVRDYCKQNKARFA